MVKVACAVCGKHEADKGVKLFMCSRCNSVPYCSKGCQRSDWKAGHKKVCDSLNAGDAQQLFHKSHENWRQSKERQVDKLLNEDFSKHPDLQLIWDLFYKSQEESSHNSTVKKIRKLVKRQTRTGRKFFLRLSLYHMAQTPTDMLELPTSPLKIVLEYVNPSLCLTTHQRHTLLHSVAFLSDAKNEVANTNQCIIAEQLLEAGVKVDARDEHDCTPLHDACCGHNATNLNFLKLLLDHGADPNARNRRGLTPLHLTMMRPPTPGAAKFLLEYSDGVDPNIVVSNTVWSVYSFLALVRLRIEGVTSDISNTVEEEQRIQNEFILGQLDDLEEILVRRGALDIRPSFE